jgi:hypothetical protein
VCAGAALLVAAVAGFVIVPEHRPQVVGGRDLAGVMFGGATVGWSRTVYDAARIATWALLIVGVLLAAVALINYARRPVVR